MVFYLLFFGIELNTNSLLDIKFTNILSHSSMLPFNCVDFLGCVEAFQFDVVPFFIFAFVTFTFGVSFKKIIAKNNVKELTATFFGSFVTLGLAVKSFIHYKLIFVCDVK